MEKSEFPDGILKNMNARSRQGYPEVPKQTAYAYLAYKGMQLLMHWLTEYQMQ